MNTRELLEKLRLAQERITVLERQLRDILREGKERPSAINTASPGGEKPLQVESGRECELRWRNALRHVSQYGISLSPSGAILFANDSFLEASGWTEEEVSGRNWFEMFLPQETRGSIHDIFKAQIHRERDEASFESAIIAKDGSLLHVAWSSVLTQGLAGLAPNITYLGLDLSDGERTRRDSITSLSEERHRRLAERLPAVVVELLPDGTVAYANQTASALLDRMDDRIGEDNSKDYFGRAAFAALRKGFAETNPDAPVTTLTTRLGQGDLARRINWRLQGRFSPSGTPRRYLAVGFDITDRSADAETLWEQKEAAETANRAKSEFLASMSHEIRTPLNGIVGMLQLLETTKLDREQQEYTHAAAKSSERLSQLLSDILDLSRIEIGKLSLDPVPFDLKETVQDVCQLFELTARQSGIALNCDLDPTIPTRLMGDQLRIQQVLNNLVDNGLNYTRAGKVQIGVYRLPATKRAPFNILFLVSDTGIGIPEERISSLFRPFTRGPASYTRHLKGTGLGLAICKHLVNMMDGSIAIDSEPDHGTTIAVSLPLQPVADGLPRREPMPADQAPATMRLHALVVEDDDVNSCVIQTMLEQTGFSVETAANGREALAALLQDAFDVVLMDIQMPEMNGLEATQAIRRGDGGERHKAVPIVAMTAYAMPGDREKMLGAGTNSYVSKPMNRTTLLDAIAEAITNNIEG